MNYKALPKHLLTILVVSLLSVASAMAQTVMIGSTTGSTSYLYGPYYRSSASSTNNYCRYAYVYTSAELGIPSGSTITQIEWYKASGTITGNNSFSIWLDNSTSTSLTSGTTWGTLTATATSVYTSATQQFIAANNSWESFALTTPFTYNGNSLMIFTDHVKSGTASAANNFYYNAASGLAIGYSSSAAPTNSSTLTTTYGANRPTIRITYIPGTPCTSPPTAGTSTASPSGSVCTGTSVALNITGYSYGSGQTYQWESSSSLSGPYTSVTTSSNTPATTITANATMYYRCAVTCSGNTSYSTPVLVTVPALFPAGNYTINAALPTSGTNFHSFSDAASAINCGIAGPIVFDVAPGSGPYNEQFLLNAIPNTSATNTITVNGNGNTITYLSSNSSERGIVRLNGTDHVTINNLVIDGSTTNTSVYAYGVLMYNNADSNTISGCTIKFDSTNTSSNFAGIAVTGDPTSPTTTGSNCDGLLITNNIITGPYYSLTIMGSTSPNLISNITITNNLIKEYYVYGIYGGGTDNMLIENNEMHRNTRASVSTFYGIYLSTFNSNLKVSKNKIHNPFTGAPTNTGSFYGIYLGSSTPAVGSENVISNNILYNLDGEGSQYILYNSSSGNTRYYYNSISSDNTGATGTGLSRGFYQITAQTGIEFKNNMISLTRGGTGVKHGLYMGSTITGFTSNYNDIYVSGSGTNNIGYWASTAYTSLATWQTASSQDANSFSQTPIYTNPANGDLTPTAGTLDNGGTPVSVLTDISGNSRNASTPDIGAYEFTILGCAGQPTAGTVSGTNNACVGGAVNLTLTGFTAATGISIQWESSPGGTGSWMPIAGATLNTISVTQTATTDYRATVTCAAGGATDYSNVYTVTQNPFYLCYCSPFTGVTLHTNAYNYITNVAIPTTTLNYATSAIGAGGFTRTDPGIAASTASLSQATPYTLNVTMAYSGYFVDAWIDYDQSGTYDAGEYIAMTMTGTTASANVVIPTSATPGMTGLRVRLNGSAAYGASNACQNSSSGYETEDYVVTIVASSPCNGTPNTATATGPTNICAGTGFSLTATGYTTGLGVSYNWESSPAGTGSWTPISGATNPIYTVATQTASTDYRFVTNCSYTGSQSVSNTVSITTNPATLCYCVSNLGGANYAWIDSVSIVGTGFQNGPTGMASTFYSSWSATANLMQGATYTMYNRYGTSTTTSAAAITSLWIDYNQNGTFESTEWTQITTNAITVATPFTIPATALTGTTGLRIRSRGTGNPNAATDACSNFGSGETEDYQVTIILNPLALQLTSINALNAGTRNRIDWKTASENRGDYFELERSTDGNEFTRIASISANGAASGYTYWDENPVNGANYYRLKLVNVNNEAGYSKVVKVIVTDVNTFSVEAVPNPVKDVLTVKLHGNADENASVSLCDVTGKVIEQVKVSGSEVVFNMNSLATGMYYVKYTGENHKQTIKVMKN